MKILVIGEGILFEEFKRLKFEVVEGVLPDSPTCDLDWGDVIINTYDKRYASSDSDSISSMYEYNSKIPKVVSDYCVANHKQFIHISTAEVYPNSSRPLNEAQPPSPKTPYEVTKLLGEQYCDPRTIILRPANVFNGSSTDDNALFHIYKNKSNIDIPISFTYSLDVIRSAVALAKAKESGIFNISSVGTVAPFSIGGVPEYLKKTSIPDLCLSSNCVNILDNTKLLAYYTPESTSEKILQCYDEILQCER